MKCINESKNLVKEGAGAGYTVRIKDLKFGSIKGKERYDDYYECKVEILPGEYEIGAEDYYNDFFWEIHEYTDEEPTAKIDGGVATIAYSTNSYDEDEADDELRREISNIEMDISFDYGAGWIHVDLPTDKPIESDHVDVEGREFYGSIDKIELNAPDLADAVNAGHQSIYDRDEDEPKEEMDESVESGSVEPTLEDIYQAVKGEYGGKLFSDDFLKLDIEKVSDQVLCIFGLDKPDDLGANDGDDEWWEDKKDSAILFYDELVKFLVDKFGEKFRFTDPRVSDEYAFASNPKAHFEIVIDEDDASLPIITIDEVSDGWYVESEENEFGTIDGWRVFDYGEDFPYTERYTVLDYDGYQFFISHNGGVGAFTEDPLEGTSEEICDELEVEIEDKMWKPVELSKKEIADNHIVMKGLKLIKVKYEYEQV